MSDIVTPLHNRKKSRAVASFKNPIRPISSYPISNVEYTQRCPCVRLSNSKDSPVHKNEDIV